MGDEGDRDGVPGAGWWARDPSGRFPRRFWDGEVWTNRVALDSGVEALDTVPVGSHPPPGALPLGADGVPRPDLPPPPAGGWVPPPTTPRWRPAAGVATVGLLGIASLVLILGLWGAQWVDGMAPDPDALIACAGELEGGRDCEEIPDARVRLTRPELTAVLDAGEEAGIDSGLSEWAKDWLDSGINTSLVVLGACVAAALLRFVPWWAVTILAVGSVLWHAAFLFHYLDATRFDVGDLGPGAWATGLALLLVAGAASTADPDGWPAP